MLAGDFTAFASPACNAGRQVTLRAPFVEQPDRSRAVQSGGGEDREAACRRRPIRAARSGTACRSTTTTRQIVRQGRLSVERQSLVFGRYIDHLRAPAADAVDAPDNILTVRREFGAEQDKRARSRTAFGDTQVFGANTVNAFRVTLEPDVQSPERSAGRVLRRAVARHQAVHLRPGVMALNVTNGVHVLGRRTRSGAASTTRPTRRPTICTLVRGRHQLAFGGERRVLDAGLVEDNARAAGDFNFNGQATGLGAGGLPHRADVARCGTARRASSD